MKELMRWNLLVPLGEPFYHMVLYLVPTWHALKLSPTWPLTTMSMMGTIFQKGQLYLAMDGEYDQLILLSLPDFLD
jgi:hypothetical protein